MNFVKNYSLAPRAYTHNVSVYPSYAAPGLDTLEIKAHVENPNNHSLSVMATIIGSDSSRIDSVYLHNGGNNLNSVTADDIWEGFC